MNPIYTHGAWQVAGCLLSDGLIVLGAAALGCLPAPPPPKKRAQAQPCKGRHCPPRQQDSCIPVG